MFLAKKIGALPRKIHCPQPHFFRSRVDFARPDLQLNCFYILLLHCCFFFARPDISLFESGQPFRYFDLPNNSLPFSTDFAHREGSFCGGVEMERKGYLLPTLGVGVGVGVGVGLGIASGQTVGVGSNSTLDSISAEQIELELSKQVVDGRKIKVSFEEFTSYLRLVVPNLISRKHTNSAATGMLYLCLHI
ncbi:hypothetical protein Cgig2_016052 [Carnegiea gigantea]|uniref:Uncharacterized protein n=1 Tax=Carnegiea gigantea TaxID=171969 RepID=A0A9Q1JX16_9CARY|nr:hypothetical protein Cgig2_016052 [Carnegiea gigantea]